MGKGENADKTAFSPFPTVFSTLSKREIVILATFNLSSANAIKIRHVQYFVVWLKARDTVIMAKTDFVIRIQFVSRNGNFLVTTKNTNKMYFTTIILSVWLRLLLKMRFKCGFRTEKKTVIVMAISTTSDVTSWPCSNLTSLCGALKYKRE